MDFDAIVIGGSYAGLSAAMQVARAGRTVRVVDAGRPRNRFAVAAHGFFGQDGVPPARMIEQARAQVCAYPTVSMMEDEVVSAQPAGEGFAVTLGSGQTITSAKLVLAHGVEDVLPELPGLAERWGKSVLHCPYCHGYEFRNRPLGVLSRLPISVHQALLISEWGPTTLFLNGQDEPDETDLDRLRRRGVAVEPAPVVELEGTAPTLAGVRLADGRRVAVNALYLAPGRRLVPLAEQLGCAIEESPVGPVIQTDAMKQTSVPGVYAAGDAAIGSGNATLAAADGVIAGAALHQSLVFGPLS